MILLANRIIAIPNSESLSSFIGKKGSENSITFYNRGTEGDVVTVLAPTSIEDKFYAMSEILTLAEAVVISAENIDKLLGESVIASGLLGKRIIFTDENDVSDIANTAGIEPYAIVNRDKLLETINSLPQIDGLQDCRVDIDKAFNVKGIGAVALGVVRSGTVNVHDELYHTSGALVQVRSLQSQDIDVKTAGVGTRVGIGMKGIAPEDVEKGTILSKSKNPFSKRIKVSFTKSKINEEPLEQGKFYGFGSGFSFSNAKIEEIKGNEMVLSLEKRLALFNGDDFLLSREKSPRIFASGKVLDRLD